MVYNNHRIKRKKVLLMQKKEYLELKNWFDKDGNKILWNILNSWRGKLNVSNDAYYIFARALFNDKKYSSKIKDNKSLEILFNRIDFEYHQLIKELRDSFSEEQLKSIVLNYYKKDIIDRENKGYGFSIQEGLINLSYKLLEINVTDKLLQPYSSDGDYLIDFIINNSNATITGIDILTENILASEIKALAIDATDKIKVQQGHYLKMNLSDIDYNKVFSVPPMGLRFRDIDNSLFNQDLINIYKDNNFTSINDWANILKIIANPKFEKAMFIVNSGILFNERDNVIRKYLVDGGYIEAVIEMPPKLFYGTSISTNILMLSKNNKSIKFVDASEFYKIDRLINIIDEESIEKILDVYSKETKISKLVNYERLKENNFTLIPKRYLLEELDIDEFYYLKELAEIKRGHANIKKSELTQRLSTDNTDIKILEAGDINDDFNIEELASLKNIEDNEVAFCAQDDDIVFARSGNYKSLLIKNIKDRRIIVNGTLYIITCDKEKINPNYLQLYLASDHCMSQLEALKAGAITPFISIKQLGEIKIPKLTKELEEELSDKYKTLLDRKEVIRLQKKKVEEDISELISEVL